MKYILVDSANLYFKSRHVATRCTTDEEKVGLAMHLTLAGVQSIVRKFAGSDPVHVVFALEGRSWRKQVYEPYKRNRATKYASLTEAEVQLDRMFWETYDQFTTYLRDRTNVSVIRSEIAEADDVIARFIHLHPVDTHFIISSDSDFAQLIAPNVQQYNSITGHLVTLEGYFDDRGRPVKDKKTSLPRELGDPQYLLFEKCMRGDTSDNVFSAYPGVRTKSTSRSTGLTEAYADRHNRGFAWNNVMLSRWVDPEGVEHRVLDDYQRNVQLCDLTAQPPEVKTTVDNAIKEQVRRVTQPNVGIYFMKFCNRYQLLKISEQAETYARWLNSPYTGELA
jgi:hypothetical protein